jgi:hypothetical protein
VTERLAQGLLKTLIITGMIALSLFLRVYSLESDPPDYLSWSAAIYVDEGYKALDARNTIKYGSNHWTPYDEYRGHRYTSRFIYDIQLWIFETFGLSIRNLRYFNIAMSIGIIACVLVTLAFIFPKRMIFMMGLAMSINVVFLFQSRIALYEFPMLLAGVLLLPAIFIFYNQHNFRSKTARAAYFVFLLALLIAVTSVGSQMKGNFFIYMVSILLAFFFSALLPFYRKRPHIPRFLELRSIFIYMIAGILLATFVLYAFQGPLGIRIRYLANPLMLLAKVWFLEMIYLQPNAFIMSVFCTFAVLKILFTKRYAHLHRKELLEYQVDLFFAMQYLFSFLFVYISSYSPLRYFLFSEVSLLFLAARFVSNYDVEIRILRSGHRAERPLLKRILIFIFVFYVVIQLLIFLVMLFINYETRKLIFDDFYLNLVQGNVRNAHAYVVFTLIALILPVIYYVAKYYDDALAFLKKHMSRKMMVFLLIEIQLIYLLSWQFNKTRMLRDCMDFINTLPAGSVIIGDWAPMLSFESDLKSIYSNPQDNRNVNNIDRIKPDYVVVKSHKNEEEQYNSYSPGLIKPKNVIYSFSVQAFDIKIYKVDKYKKHPGPVH